MRRFIQLGGAALLFSVAWSGGCDSSPDAACEEVVRAQCERTAACEPAYFYLVDFPDVESCAERNALFCPKIRELTGTHYRSDQVGQCASDIADATCESLTKTFRSAACDAAFRGTLTPGQACA